MVVCNLEHVAICLRQCVWIWYIPATLRQIIKIHPIFVSMFTLHRSFQFQLVPSAGERTRAASSQNFHPKNPKQPCATKVSQYLQSLQQFHPIYTQISKVTGVITRSSKEFYKVPWDTNDDQVSTLLPTKHSTLSQAIIWGAKQIIIYIYNYS